LETAFHLPSPPCPFADIPFPGPTWGSSFLSAHTIGTR
jgi:hypothetical protein